MENDPAENYEEKIKHQTELVKKIADDDKRNPSDETKLRLARESDFLRHLMKSAEDEPKPRAHRAAESARDFALSRAVVQVPPPED